MRFLIDVTDLQRRRRDKYDRVVRRFDSEARAQGGGVVELRAGGRELVAAGPLASESRAPDWTGTRWTTPVRVDALRRAAKLGARYAAWRLIGRTPSGDEKDLLAWDLAYGLEAVPMGFRPALSRFLEIEAEPARAEKFRHWLGERTRSGALVADREETPVAQSLSPQAGDVLILAGASWNHVEIDALETLKRAGVRLVFVLFDLLPVDFPSVVTSAQRARFKGFMLGAGRIADALLFPSAAAAVRFDAFFAQAGVAATARRGAIDLRAAALNGGEEKKPRGAALDGPFMLCPSSLRERKHALWLYAICAKLRAKRRDLPRLVFAGSADDMRVRRILMSDPLWAEAASFIESPSDAELRWLYRHAKLCLYPAFEASLGMAVMEAEIFGRPCIAAQTPVLAAAGGARALLLPRDEAQWEAAICRLLDEGAGVAAQIPAPPPLLDQLLPLVAPQ